MSRFRLRVLGGFMLEDSSGAPRSPLPKRRADAVLAALAVSGDLGCSRERLVALLWPESDEAHARHGLRDALHLIRRALGPEAVPSGGRLLRLDAAVVTSDLAAFSGAVGAGRHAEAVRAYTGPLLDGFHLDGAPEFERWLDGERTRLSREYLESLKRLAAGAEAAGGWDEAVAWWARAVEHDPLNSHLVLQHVRALAAIGDRANAIRLADAHARRLREDLDVEPDAEVLAQVERIRRGEGTARPLAKPEPPPQQATGEAANRPSDLSNGPALGTAPRARRPRRRWIAWAASLTILGTIGWGLWPGRQPASGTSRPRHPRTTIAVLPFRNLTPDSTRAAFASGLHDELLTQLTRVGALRVVGRSSVGSYQETSKPLRQVGEELAAGSIVEGSVQVDGKRLRVIVRLLDPATQEDLWADRYDRTLDDAFEVQSEIARRIVAAVGARLTRSEEAAIGTAPTGNADAYQLYLQGLDYELRPGVLRGNLEVAAQLYARAISLDSLFAPAHAAAAIVDYGLYSLGFDPRPDRLERARRAADIALQLAPDLPRAHLAKGLVRHAAVADYRGELAEFQAGLRTAPSDAELWTWAGRAHRYLANWDSALVALERARQLNPRAPGLLQTIGDTYHYLHRYHEAIAAYRQQAVLAPDLAQPRLSIAWSYVLWTGTLDTLRAVLRGLPLEADPGLLGHSVVSNRLALALLDRNPARILALLDSTGTGGTKAMDEATFLSWKETASRLRGDSTHARILLDSTLRVLNEELRKRPSDRGTHAARGEVLARLGRPAEARRELEWLGSGVPGFRDRFEDGRVERARILMLAGDLKAAFAEIEPAVAEPSVISVHYLRLDPRWDPLTRDPRFSALLARYGRRGG